LEEALESYSTALERIPLNMRTKVLSNLGLLFQDMRELDSAVAMFTEALALEPDNVDANSRLSTPPFPSVFFLLMHCCFCRVAVLLFCCSAVLLFCCSAVLLFCCCLLLFCCCSAATCCYLLLLAATCCYLLLLAATCCSCFCRNPPNVTQPHHCGWLQSLCLSLLGNMTKWCSGGSNS
jgi:tetratricopeptide (TPR) repeat protein